MKYDKDTTDQISARYLAGETAADLANSLSQSLGVSVPERSVIAKLASLGIYKKKEYRTKRGEVPVPKAEYIEKIAKLLNTDSEFLESLEKVNKSVLALIHEKLYGSEVLHTSLIAKAALDADEGPAPHQTDPKLDNETLRVSVDYT